MLGRWEGKKGNKEATEKKRIYFETKVTEIVDKTLKSLGLQNKVSATTDAFKENEIFTYDSQTLNIL